MHALLISPRVTKPRSVPEPGSTCSEPPGGGYVLRLTTVRIQTLSVQNQHMCEVYLETVKATSKMSLTRMPPPTTKPPSAALTNHLLHPSLLLSSKMAIIHNWKIMSGYYSPGSV